MLELPIIIPIIFLSTLMITLYLFIKASKLRIRISTIIILWGSFQSILSYQHFYLNISQNPIKFLLVLFPPIMLIVFLFITPKGRRMIDQYDIKWLTLLHIIRLPIEIVLYFLFVYKFIPINMTFEGRNFDILLGISAPLVYYFVLIKNNWSLNILLAWQILGLLSLFNIVANALLSAPLPIQQFGFDQPNIAILYFPFILLPAIIVPIVLFAHLIVIRKIIRSWILKKG